MATTSESIVDLHHDISFDEKDELDSLPSSASSDVYSDADSEAQAEWERSLEQLQLILTMMIVPWMGKFFGRKFAYWSELSSGLVGFIKRLESTPRRLSVCKMLTSRHSSRLGQIHAMDSQCRNTVYKQEEIRGCGCCPGGNNIVYSHYKLARERAKLDKIPGWS